MEIKLHYLPEKPYFSCQVLVFHRSKTTGNIYNVTNVNYSAKYGMFNAYDTQFTDELNDEYGDDICAWAFMDDVEPEVLRCLRDGI